MSTCVNLNLKEFKDCCKRLNVSPTTLEPIVHEYINIEGNENSFPSDAYISERIHGREVSVLSDAQIKVWERKFSEPKTFNSNEEAVAYYNEARKYFPKEAIGFKETRNSKYEVRVAEPFKSGELEDIKKKAITDGTFMKAPNGKPTNLTEQQWLHVRTKAFKRWFGDWENDPENASKVVDENGEPLVVYHHTDNPTLTKFSTDFDNYFSKDGGTKSAIFFDEEKTGTLNRKYDMPVFLNIKNLNEYNETKAQLHERGTTYREIVNQSAETNPVDGGVHMKNFDDNMKEHQSIWIVHNSNQIKSATDNIGTYSLEDNNIYYNKVTNPYSVVRKNKKILVLSPKTSESFATCISKANGKYPKRFQDYDTSYIYIKSNNRKNSRKYNIIDINTGEVIAQNIVLYTQEEYNRLLENRKKFESEYKQYNEKRSLAYKKGLMTPSKGLFKRMTKQYLLEAIYASKDISEHTINIELIDNFVDKFDDTFLEHVVTFLLEPSFYMSEEGPSKYEKSVMGLTTSDLNVFAERFTFNTSIPKHGLLQKLEEKLNTKIIGKKVKTFTDNGLEEIIISRELDYKTLKIVLKAFISQEFPISEEESIKAYAKAHNLSIEEVNDYINKLRDYADIASSKEKERITTFNPNVAEIYNIIKEYNKEYSKYLKERGIAIPENLVHIILNRDSYAGEDTPLIRLATILHEPYHALSILLKGSKEHNDVINAFEAFINTPEGKVLYDKYASKNKSYDDYVLHEEFLADLFSFIMMPKELRSDYSLLENKEGFLGPELAKLIDELLSKPEVIKLVSNKETVITEQVLEKYTEEEKVILPLLKSVYNAIVKWLSKYSKLIKNTFKLFEESKLVEKTRLVNIEKKAFTVEELEVIDEDLIVTKEALSQLSSAMEILMSTEIDSQGVKQLTKASYMNSSQNNLTEFFSGAALGSDTEWANVAREQSIKVTEYTPKEYNDLSQEEKDKVEQEYQETRKFLGRPNITGYSGGLVRRDMMQADSADAIFGIVEKVVKPGEKDSNYINTTNHENVAGGTAYAVARGILRGIPVYVFDQSDKQWKVWDSKTNSFVTTLEPKLTPKAATIGTRKINESGKQAIKNIITNTLEASSTVEYQKTPLHLSKDEIEKVAKEIQESLGVTEEEARELAELFDTDNTEEELKQKQQSEEKEDKVRKHLLSIDAQIKELTESNVISRSEITELAYDIVYTVSDFLTQWQNDPKLVIEKFNKDEKDIEKIKTMSRKELANYIGINNIFDFIKEAYFGEIKPTDSDEVIEKKEVIYDNFEAILQFGKSAFNTIEDFSIGYSEVGYNTKDKSENDNESELTNEEQTAKEELGDKQEHWQIDSRTIDNFLSMSQTVKRELLNLYELEEVVKDGISVIQPKLNAFGMKKRVSPKDATSSILRWTRGALTLKQMIVKLQEKEDKHPWVKELITKLSDDNKTGKYTDFQSQFFNVFCKHFQDYYAVTKETNKDGTTITKVIPLNLNPALKGAVDAIKILYQVRRHPLFDKSGKVDISALNTLKKYKELLEKITDKPFEEIDLDRVKTGIFKISQLLGFSTTEEEISQILSTNNIKTFIKNLDNIVDNLEKGAKLQNYSPFDFKEANSISGYIREFIRPITERREDTAISSLYDSGKMYQSYVIPSWLSKTMDKFMNLEGEEYERFLMEEYGQYDWFRDTSVEDVTDTTAWRCPWLKRLANASLEERRKIFGHHVQLNYLGHNYMKNMSGPEYTLSVINEFFTDTTDSKESIGTAWYKIPMMSNKPSAEFIKFIRYKGLTYKNDITKELVNVYIQELMRIQTVIQRGYTKNDPEFIKAFDNRGKHFLFLDYLDEYLNGSKKNQELGKLLNAKVLGKKLPDATITVKGETKIISGEQRLLDLVKNEIRTQMDAKVASIIESYKANGIFEAAKNVQGVSKTDEELTRDLENFIWNDTFASINILQMTITDLAYYKDTEDVQKRLAQIHAPGMRPNVEATDYEGNRVCPDGMFRTAFLKDFEGKAVFELDEIIQNVIDNIEVVFQRKIDVAKSNNNKIEEEYWTSTMNFIIDQLKETVNVADAQAFNCPTSYRKKALMFGKWDKKYEEVYQKLKNKEYNINDLEAAFQPLKPFVYTSTSKNSGVANAPIKNMKVGMQFKNSEYLLIMADAILRGEDTGKPNLLRAIFDVMEESAKKHPGKGIDSIMFGSAVKAGLHGQIDIADSMTEEEAKARLEVIFDSNSKDGMYNPTFVHTYPAEDYTIQQEVPAHFMDHDQAHGTQERMIIPSDLPLVDENGNEVFFEYYDYKEGKVVKKNAKEFRKAYEENIAKSINQNLEELEDALGLNIVGPDARRQRNIKLSKILQEEILSSPRYGIDLYVACSVNEKGEFNIPLGDPVQSKRVEQLINSVIKNRLNKQKIAGGPVVQVSNFGMSKRLSIKFKKEDGTILPTFKEWQAENENGTIEDYKEMLKKEQAGIAHYECYAPAYMKEMFECFMNEKGELDVEAMEKSNPEMLEMVGYRIPSEDAYSVAPLKIVGFLPKEAGEGIVMPYEITLITGSDFDKH